jgi:NAD(P)-dependent dehydrogenase (short-subunit alcohol dehydrogenase family)
MLEEFSLKGKVAVIAAGGQSWAGALARHLHGEGAKVVLATGDRDEINELTGTLPPEDVLGIPGNLTDEREIEGVAERAVARFGKIDILVNNFNLEVWKPLLEMTEKDWQQLLQANLTPAFLSCKAAGRYLVAQKSGSVINVISALAERGIPTGAAYCASIGAVLELTRSLALEWAASNVRVNAVGVGWKERPAAGEGKDIMLRYIPAQRRARAEDVVPLVGFLASDAASFLSGCIYTVDGGLMARA